MVCPVCVAQDILVKFLIYQERISRYTFYTLIFLPCNRYISFSKYSLYIGYHLNKADVSGLGKCWLTSV